MSEILLVEPDYRSKFPPLGLMRIATYHRDIGDTVAFVRGLQPDMKARSWHRVYVSSLFTWQLPKTVRTLRYYASSVSSPDSLFVGGVGATLLPDYIARSTKCRIVPGLLSRANMLGRGSPTIAKLPPDYDILHAVDYTYVPLDAYFLRITQGCVRKCHFCAVPRLEPEFRYLQNVRTQISDVDARYGEKHDLVVLDNNILALDNVESILAHIADVGFQAGAKRNNRKRSVDFNQGIDARIVARHPSLARALSSICLSPVRLAFDQVTMEQSYVKAINAFANQGFSEFTNYMLFNFNDTPRDLYHRLMFNVSLNEELRIRITGFPMRFLPMDRVDRAYVAPGWKWRYLRGIQCVLLATHGLVSPNPHFVRRAFGDSYEHFIEILSMPDRYIVHRERYERDQAKDWRRLFRRLSQSQRDEFLDALAIINKSRDKKNTIGEFKVFRALLEHYYPRGKPTPCE
ncbi:MAG: radical SAM protein [Phycisphaerae bacterium]|nr:radical SAM protein [Phycisphaerae bacterium]